MALIILTPFMVVGFFNALGLINMKIGRYYIHKCSAITNKETCNSTTMCRYEKLERTSFATVMNTVYYEACVSVWPYAEERVIIPIKKLP